MADVAAKREARRRRILENSEYRLQRITGHVNQNESSDEQSKKVIGNDAQPTTSSSNPNGILASEALMENQSVDSLINEFNADIDAEESATKSVYATEHDIFTLLSAPNLPYRRSGARSSVSGENGNVGSIKLNTSNDVRFSPERQDSQSPPLENFDKDVPNENIVLEASSANAILSGRLVYVVLAIVVNILMTLKLEHLFGTSIVIPFFVIMIGQICVSKDNYVAKGNNLLVAALILSNVRPDFVKVIQKLKDSFSLFSKVFHDFAIYIFTFVLVHNLLYRYWNDLDDIVAFRDDPETTFNDRTSI